MSYLNRANNYKPTGEVNSELPKCRKIQIHRNRRYWWLGFCPRCTCKDGIKVARPGEWESVIDWADRHMFKCDGWRNQREGV